MANKAIIGITREGKMHAELKELARRIDAGEQLPETDYHLSFSSAAQLFSELTPARMRTLEVLKKSGPLTIYALAKRLGRNYSNVHADIGKLLEYELVAKDEGGRVYVPWDTVEIHVSLADQVVGTGVVQYPARSTEQLNST